MKAWAAFGRNCKIAWDLALRDLQQRFSHASLGVAWLLVTPLCLAGIYWFVFSQVLDLSWKDPATGAPVGYIAPFFAGLAGFLFFNDVAVSSLGVFHRKRTYVRRSPFPPWVLWLSNLMRAGVTAGATLLVLLAVAASSGVLKIEALIWTPVALALVAFMGVALSLTLAVLGPFLGDLEEGARVLFRMLFYAAPVTYPLELVPAQFAPFAWLNPVTVIAEALRAGAVFGQPPPLAPALAHLAAFAAIGAIGLWLYRRAKGAIVDVV